MSREPRQPGLAKEMFGEAVDRLLSGTMSNFQIKAKASAVVVVCAGFLLTGCAHYKEESGRKTEFNHDTGRFETSEYVSAGFSTSVRKKPALPVKEKDLEKLEGK